MPLTLPRDKGTYFIDQNGARIPQYPFGPLFQATAVTNPEFRFDDVDVVVNRNSLRKLLNLCAGRSQDSFRINLLLVHNSLFIERCERNPRELVRGSQDSGWGRNFERAFTKYPDGVADLSGHHRALRYQFGNLNCVVQFEVDASYEARPNKESTEQPIGQAVDFRNMKFLTLGVDKLSSKSLIADICAKDQAIETKSRMQLQPQSQAVEIKTGKAFKGLSNRLPQLWFGRTPWLIDGRHTHGTFEEVRVTNASDSFEEWETKNQLGLRKLVTVLTQLREVIKKNKGRMCVAIYERGSSPQGMKIFASTAGKRVLPGDLTHEFWDHTLR